MCGELKSGLDRGPNNGKEALFGDKENAAILRIGNGVNLANAPWLAHIGAAGEHATVEEHLHTDDAQHVVILFRQGMGGDAPNIGKDICEGSARTKFMGNVYAHG